MEKIFCSIKVCTERPIIVPQEPSCADVHRVACSITRLLSCCHNCDMLHIENLATQSTINYHLQNQLAPTTIANLGKVLVVMLGYERMETRQGKTSTTWPGVTTIPGKQ